MGYAPAVDVTDQGSVVKIPTPAQAAGISGWRAKHEGSGRPIMPGKVYCSSGVSEALKTTARSPRTSAADATACAGSSGPPLRGVPSTKHIAITTVLQATSNSRPRVTTVPSPANMSAAYLRCLCRPDGIDGRSGSGETSGAAVE